MSSFYDDASLVVIPSGYKTSKVYAEKPTDGSGDLTFTRTGDTATRVNSAGLIEKVRTNLLTYSNTFSNAAWAVDQVTKTTGQTDPNGGTTAVLLTSTNTSSTYMYQTKAGLGCLSIYAKVGTRSTFALIPTSYNNGAFFDLSSVTATASGIGSLAKIESVGGGWFRCSVATSSSTDFIVSLSNIAGTGSVIGDTMTFAFAQGETGDVATSYIPTTTAAVSVGPVANVPRLDYLGSTCPRLILEPQRSNLVQYSEQFNNAYWIKSNATITANTTVSPDGTQNADTAVITAGGYIYAEFISYAAVSGQSATLSVFAKDATSTLLFFGGATTAGTDVYKIENYGNGWYRHSVVRTFTATATTTLQYIISLVGTSIIWGAQVEGSNSSYATSYIPTLAASATRGADACSKTGISSLIGQTEGAFYCEVDMQNLDKAPQQLLELHQDANNRIGIAAFWDSFLSVNRMQIYQFFGGGLEVNIQETITSGVLKVAAAYKANDYVLYINGVQIGTDTSASVPATSIIYIGSNGSTFFVGNGVKQALLFKTRLTNAELAELTTL